MSGLNRYHGGSISGTAQLNQNIIDLLSTPLGSRLCLRDYGSQIPALIDAPQNQATAQLLAAASASAINRWIKNLKITKCVPKFSSSGVLSLELTGYRTDLPVGDLGLDEAYSPHPEAPSNFSLLVNLAGTFLQAQTEQYLISPKSID